ncbi:hypothetical protein EV426DRAFT_719638 [Tirmania nivea]|nr:hypothetical protein EV426DRAFT_719638 [Tirmania nivea]
MLGYKDSTPHQIPIGELNTGGLTPRVHRWLDGCDDEDVNPPVTSDPRFLIRDSDDVEDLYSVGVPQHTETDRSTDIQGDSPRETERGKDNHMENDWFDIPEDIQEPSQSKPDSAFAPPGAPLLVLRPPESNSTSHCTLGPPRYGSFVRTLTSGPRRGSDGVPAHNTHTHALSNRTMPLGSESIDMNLISGIPSGSVNPAIPRKLVKSTLAGRLRRATSNWMAGNRKPAMKRLSAMNSRPNSAISPALESSTAAEDVLALSAMGYIAPLGSNLAGSDITLEERFHTTEDNPTARGSGNKGVSRLKKLKSFASLSNLAAAFKIGDSAQATVEKKSSRNMVISAPISTTGNPEMIEQANRVRQQMLEAMGGLEGVSLASSRYAGTIPGTILGEGAIRVDPQDGCGRNNRANSKQRSKDGEYPGLGERQDNTGEHESEGVLERALRTRTQKKPLGAHSIFSTVDNAPRITSPGTVDPHEGRAYEGIWSGPGIAVNTPEGGIRVIQQQMRETEETSPYLDPHPGVPFYIPEDAPEPTPLGIHRTARGHPTSQEGPTMGHLLGSPGISFPSAATSLSDPFGWEREYERTYGPTSPPRRAVPSCGGNSGQTHMPVRENAPVWSLLRKANNRFFGRTKGESGAAQQEDSIAGPIIPPKSLPKSAPKTPKRKGSSTAASATMPSRTEQPGNTKLTSSDVEATTAQGGVVQPRVMPMSISSSRESQRFPDSVETTPFVLPQTRRDTGTQPGSDDKLGNPTATSEARQNDNTNGSEDKVVDGVIVTSPQPEQTDTNWSDTESGRDEAAATTEHHRKQSISNSDTYAALRVILDQSSSDSEHAEAHALPGPITSLHRPLTTDGVADTEHMLAVHQIETAQQERQVAVGVAKETACKREQAEAINKSTEKLKGSENLRPPGNSGTFLVSSTPQAGGGGQTGTLSSRSPPLPFVLGSEDDPFYDADLEDSMQTASRQLVTESLNSGEPTLFANTRSQLLTAFRNSSSVNTPTGGPLQEHRIPFSHAQMPENASQWMPDRSEAYHSHQSQIPEAQRVLLEQQGLADTQLYRPPHSRLEQEMIARRVRENRFLTENHRRILAGQIPLLSIEEQERLAPRSGPSPPPAFRARNDTTGALFLRPVTPTLTSSRMERMAVSPPDSPTPLGDGGVGRESLV